MLAHLKMVVLLVVTPLLVSKRNKIFMLFSVLSNLRLSGIFWYFDIDQFFIQGQCLMPRDKSLLSLTGEHYVTMRQQEVCFNQLNFFLQFLQIVKIEEIHQIPFLNFVPIFFAYFEIFGSVSTPPEK